MAVDQLLKRQFWVVILVLTSVAAFFDAQGVTQLAGAGLAPDESALAAPPVVSRLPPSASGGTSHSISADAILSRNPFDSVTGPLNLVAAAASDSAEAAPMAPLDMSDPFNAPACDGVKVIIIAASTNPDWSFAAFESTGAPGAAASPESGKSVMRRRGGEVDGKQVKYIAWDRVWLASGSTLCQARMFAPPPPPSASASVHPPAAVPSAGGAGVSPDISKGIQKIGPNEYNIDRGVVDKILENQAELMRQARIVPETENGKVVGIRLYGVRPDTLLGVLGMENGDRLEKINGFDMASPEKALEAYARLRTADKLTVQLNRRGAETNLDFNIK
jgi:general secretion pathway protein C